MLKIERISKTFDPNSINAKKALDDLSLNAQDGDFITIIGANGAGKSTLFNAIGGSFFVDSGRIVLDDQDITYVKSNLRAKKIGHLFQDPLSSTAPDMSIIENLALAGMNKGLFSRISTNDRTYFQQKLKELGMDLEQRMDTPVRLLSGGQRQALGLLMATVNKPQLLLLDEHTAALDPGSAEKVMELTSRVVEENHITCLMITHDMKKAIEYGNKIVMMDQGKIIQTIDKNRQKDITVENLIRSFRTNQGKDLVNDRMLLGL
ncbi:MAG: ATP-binding cassette domain-containing protein [Erysipelotrichaceae bacterium]|nr:ATP-binding cassette domain-containing protein [Erysipelotrichaceae bacterium]